MNRDKLISIMTEIREKREGLMIKKASDYANNIDVLANFKRMRQLCGVLSILPASSPFGCAMFLALLKIDRWCNLRLKGTPPQNESIKDTLADLHNYLDLAYACQLEEEQET